MTLFLEQLIILLNCQFVICPNDKDIQLMTDSASGRKTMGARYKYYWAIHFHYCNDMGSQNQGHSHTMITTMQTGTPPCSTECHITYIGLRLHSKTSGKNERRKEHDKPTRVHSPPDDCIYTTYLTAIFSSGCLHCLVLYTVDSFHSCLKQTVIHTAFVFIMLPQRMERLYRIKLNVQLKLLNVWICIKFL